MMLATESTILQLSLDSFNYYYVGTSHLTSLSKLSPCKRYVTAENNGSGGSHGSIFVPWVLNADIAYMSASQQQLLAPAQCCDIPHQMGSRPQHQCEDRLMGSAGPAPIRFPLVTQPLTH